MGRNSKNIYIFISDENGMYVKANMLSNGNYSITRNMQPYPIRYSPSNILDCQTEFGTNKKYFSLNRSISYPLEFIKDGAAILRDLYYNGKGSEQLAYITIVQWDGILGYYTICYKGKVDFIQKKEDPKSGKFIVPCVDDSVWGVISQNDSVEYSVDCSPSNPKAVKVLIDGITLLNRYTFQTVQAPIIHNTANNENTIPFVLVNEDGDASGVLAKSQVLSKFNTFPDLTPVKGGYFFTTVYALNNVNISGSFKFSWSTNTLPSGGIIVQFATNLGQRFVIFANGYVVTPFDLIVGKIYNIEFDININLASGEEIYFLVELNDNAARNFTITPIVTNIVVSIKTVAEPQIAYGLRPLDLLKDIVRQATNGRFTIESNFLELNNKSICLSGDAIRGFQNARIFTSFEDFFKTFDSINFMALRMVGEELFLEKAIEVYKQDSEIIDLGDCIDLEISCAADYFANEIEVGSPKVDLRHPSGRMEFNSVNTFSMRVLNSSKKLNFVSKYRLGCYDIQFLILDYRESSTQDNTGDKSVYVIEITDEKGSAQLDVETFELVTIDNAVLNPIIKSPSSDDTITYNKPTVSGISIPLSNINIYVDSVLDGNTTSDANGDWTYDILTALSSYVFGISTGIHIIEASYTTLAAPITSVTVLINTSITTPVQLTYPSDGDGLYNNKPLIKGVAQFGTSVPLFVDGVLIGTPVANGSGIWEFQTTLLNNGTRVISANGLDTATVQVNSFTDFPLITYIGCQLDGFLIVNNLPLIKGVGIPGTVVSIWLNYIPYSPLGTVIIDNNGNWEFQVVPVNYIDPLSGLPVTLAPIQNGLNTISTFLVNKTVPINVKGYKLNRPAYSSIVGVVDNTVFNTTVSPIRMLKNHGPLLASILDKQRLEKVYFQTSDKNANLETTLNGVTVKERYDIPVSSLGDPIARLEYVNIKTRTKSSFSKTLENFNNGGVVKTTFRGSEIFMLPIGTMKMANVTSDVQEWRLLLSPLTQYSTLLNLYKNGLIINIMRNSIYHSDYNSLHFVKYGFIKDPKYSYATMYQDWFNNRNEQWLLNPDYIQKYQGTDVIVDQIIANGISNIKLKMYRCSDALVEQEFDYTPVSPAPIPGPEVVFETTIDFGTIDNGQYFFVLGYLQDPLDPLTFVNLAISERVENKKQLPWKNTILIESRNSINMTGAFFSTSFKTVLRIEGLVKKWQSDIDTIISKNEVGDTNLIYSINSKKATIRFGNAYGLPDYLYNKVASALTLDELKVEGINYTLEPDEKITPSDDVDGHPLYYYNVNLALTINDKGNSFITPGGSSGVILVVDATAFGLPVGSLINIELENE